MTTAINLPADKFDTSTTFVRPDPAPTRVPLDKLAVLPGFNTRVKDAEYNERVAGIAESIVANGFFDDKPFAVTMLPDDETVYIYDGEHRFDASKQALLDGAEFPDGLPVAWAKDGATVKDLTIHLAHGNNGERLNMVELAAVVRRMQGLGMDKAEIAAALGRTARHVDNLFVLADANQQVKKAVASGKIAGAEAVKLLRKDKSTAAAKIAEAVKKAEEKGKAKATPKTMNSSDAPKGPKTKTVPMSLNFPVGKTMGEMLKAMATEIREFVEFDKESDTIKTDALIRFSVTTIDREAEAAAAERAKEREAAAAKRAEEKQAREEQKAKEKAEREAKKEAEAKEKQAKKEAEAKLLAEAAKGGAKKPAASKPKGSTKPKASGTKGKAASGGKAAQSSQKPAQADSKAEATQVPPETGSASSGPESGENGASLPDESMGGL